VSCAGLVPLLELAERAGLSRLLDAHVRFTSERVKSGAANATSKLTSIIAGMATGADSIDDLDVVRSGGLKRVFGGVYASTTLGILLREFTHGHTRQLSTVLRNHLIALAQHTTVLDGIGRRCFIDIDSLLRPVYGHAKQGASFGHTKVSGKAVLRRGLSPLAVTLCTETAAPVLAGVRLRAGRAGSAKGAASMLTAINTAVAAGAQPATILVRGDSAYGNGKVIAAVVKTGAAFSFAITRNPAVDASIAGIPGQAIRCGALPRRGRRSRHRPTDLQRAGGRSAIHRVRRHPL
jgi:Transposase DDE domain group 1